MVILLYYFCSFRCYTTDSLDDTYSQKLIEIVCKERVAKIEMVHFDVNSVVSVKFEVKICPQPRKSQSPGKYCTSHKGTQGLFGVEDSNSLWWQM